MAQPRDADYDQVHLFPATLEDWIPADHPARFVREFVAAVSDDLRLDWGNGAQGAPPYSGALLLRVWLYGYYEGVRSCRGLERACRERLGFVWLAGTHAPDHNTLWRFFQRNREALGGLFKQTVKTALAADCIGFVLHAVDGTRLPAASATRSGLHRNVLDKRLAKLDERIAALEAQIAAAGPQCEAAVDDALPQALRDTQALRNAVRTARDTLALEGAEHLQPQEPEARIQKLPDGRKLFGYNAQAVADAASGLLVAQDVVPDENDLDQLVPLLEQAQETLGRSADLTAADKGYARGASLQAASDAGLNACVALPKPQAGRPDEPYHSARFTYEDGPDTVRCPQGRCLPYLKDRSHPDKGYTVKVYRCPHEDCPVRAQCTQNKQGREIEVAPFHAALAEQRALNASPQGRAALEARKHVIEPVFGQIKEGGHFRRFTLRGLEGVQVQWALVCAAFNLKKLYARWLIHAGGRPGPAAAPATRRSQPAGMPQAA